MGIIQRQSLKFTVLNFIATFIGFLSVVFIYPLNKEIYGFFQSMHSYASLLVPILGLGIHGAIIKYFPIFTQKNASSNFLSFTLVITTICCLGGMIIIGVVYYLFYPFLENLLDNFRIIDQNKSLILALSFIFLYSSVFLYHATSLLRIVVPDLINTVGLKIFLPLAILGFYYGYGDKSDFIIWILIYFIFVSILLLGYVMTLTPHTFKPKLDTLNKEEYKQMFGFMTFSSFNALGATFALKMDIAMIAAMISLPAVGIYSIILVISNVMDIPGKAINQIASPVISRNWVENDVKNIQDIYQKSSVYGTIIGVFLFLVIYFIWVDIITLMPKDKNYFDLNTALMVFGFLGFAKITDLVTGVNSIIISYSEQYKYHMYFLLFLGIVNLFLNYFLLIWFGLPGAAAATSLSFLLFNIMKHRFVKNRFGLNLHLGAHGWIFSAGMINFLILFFVNINYHPIINMIVKTILTSMIFGLLMWFTNPGGELRLIIKDIFYSLKDQLTTALKFSKK